LHCAFGEVAVVCAARLYFTPAPVKGGEEGFATGLNTVFTEPDFRRITATAQKLDAFPE